MATNIIFHDLFYIYQTLSEFISFAY